MSSIALRWLALGRLDVRPLGMHNTNQDFEYPGINEGHPVRLHCLSRITSAQWDENAAEPSIQLKR